jgi:hypothetical protein
VGDRTAVSSSTPRNGPDVIRTAAMPLLFAPAAADPPSAHVREARRSARPDTFSR